MDYTELDSFVIYICMEGACTVTDDEGNTVACRLENLYCSQLQPKHWM